MHRRTLFKAVPGVVASGVALPRLALAPSRAPPVLRNVPRPQMAEGAVEEDDGRIWTVTLRDGPRFHDGERVLARDAAASLRRWMKRSAIGQKLEAATEELSVLDDRRLRFRLKRRFPLLLTAL